MMRITSGRRHSGAVLLETAMWVPVLLLLFLGTVELGRMTYTYYTISKMLYGIGRTAGIQQGVNFCDGSDPTITSIKNLFLTGSADGSGDLIVPGLTASLINIRIERYAADTAALSECQCDATATGCDAAGGSPPPDFLVVSIPDGYPIQLRIPGLPFDPILLRPQSRVPFGGL